MNLSLRWSWLGNKKGIFSFFSDKQTLTFNSWFTKDFVSLMIGRDGRKTQINKISFMKSFSYLRLQVFLIKHRNKIRERKWKLGFHEVREIFAESGHHVKLICRCGVSQSKFLTLSLAKTLFYSILCFFTFLLLSKNAYSSTSPIWSPPAHKAPRILSALKTQYTFL